MRLNPKILFAVIFFRPALVFSNENINKSKLFIEELGQEVMGKVSNPSISDSQRHNNFKTIYLSAFDNYYISRFVLGRHWKKIDKQIQNRFVRSFNNYVVKTYAPKFKGWEGEVKAVDSTIENNYYNVITNIINKDGPILKLQWKMYLNKNKKFKILDVNIDGVSMLVTQRAEFSSVIKNHPKGVAGLIDAMEAKTTSTTDS